MLTLPDDRAPTGLPDPGIEALAHTKIASTISTVVADGYAVVLSTADIANSLLANAIGYPIAASVALVTPAAGANSSCWPADPSQHHRIAESASMRLGLEHNLAEHTAVVQTLQRGLCFRQRIALRRRRSEPQKDQLV